MFRITVLVVLAGLIFVPGRALAGQQGTQPQAAAWTGKWIAAPWSTERDGAELDGSRPMPVFRRAFTLRRMPVAAVLRIAGLGQYEASVNGVSPGNSHAALHEAWTDYRKTVTFDSYDVRATLRVGANALGVMLGNGMYNVQRTKGRYTKGRYTKFGGSFGAPKMIAELRLRYEDGSEEVIGSDASWKVAKGPIVFSSTYGGEDYDARRAQQGWESPGFDDAAWTAATVVDGPGGTMTAAIAPELHTESLSIVTKKTVLGPDKVVYDLGQNFAGWPWVKVKGPAGAVLRLTPGELLNPDGSVSQASSGGPQWWSYTLRGGGEEQWQPKFSYYGFRYVQAEWSGVDAKDSPQIISLEGRVLRSDSPVSGSFESSNGMLNAIHKLIVEAMHNNEVSLFTDCPHREKLGWLEETHLVASGLMFNNDLRGLYAATAQNIADAQKADGMVPTIAPQYTMFGPKYAVFDDSPEWGSASILAAWAAYRFYGDASALKREYPAMQRYIAYLEGRAQDGIVAYGLGDWYDIGPGGPGVSKLTTLGVTGTLMLYEDAVDMRKIALLLGHADDANRYGALAEREKAAFNARFWDEKAGYYDRGSQTANAMPLALGVVPEAHRQQVLEHVVADIHAHNDHVTAGEVGYPYMLRALMDAGRNDVLLAMMLRKDPPSYGSQLAAGATSLTEAWDANPKNSQDHFMLGGAEEWFYRGLGGIDFDMSRPEAAARITIAPRIVDGVAWVRCSYDSALGMVKSAWNRDGAVTTLDVVMPAEGTIVLPLRTAGASVTEDGRDAAKAAGVTLVRRDDTVVVLRVERGIYRFVVRGS
jgi:hypothetical protein